MKLKLFIPFAASVLLIAGCANRLLREAQIHYDNYEFAAAARIYETYLKNDSDKTVMLRLADCYRQMNHDSAAEQWYARGINSPDASADDKLHYGEVLRSVGKYDVAGKVYSDYLALHPNDPFAEAQLRSCDSAEKLSTVTPYYRITEVDFGFQGSAFSTVAYGNELLVTAEAPVTAGGPVNNWTGRGYLDLYVATEKKNLPEPTLYATNGHLGGPPKEFSVTPLPGMVNSELHEGPAAISADGDVIYFTRSSVQDGKASAAEDRDNHLELCRAERVNDLWTNIKSLPFNNKEYSCGHPAISSVNNRLYFISDKPGGYGGTDIYYSELVNDVWSNPVNAGERINTAGNEMFPTICKLPGQAEQLYYSTDGSMGIGGLDIFRIPTSGLTTQSPVHLSAPFNSGSDDFGVLFLQNGQEGYFSSSRSSTQGIDKIFHFHRLQPAFVVNFTVVDKESLLPVPNTDVEVFNGKDNTTTKMKTDLNGQLIFGADSLTGYGFTLRCDEYFCGFGSVRTGGFTGKLNDTTFLVVPLEKIVLNKPIRLENIYYDYNKWDIRPDAAIELDKLVKIMIDNPAIKIELSSHTDSRGGDNYNMKLSQKRAQSAVDYIISKGVSKDRITAKGYGESKPLNRCTNGVKCTEEEWQFNRRTEFKVVEIAR